MVKGVSWDGDDGDDVCQSPHKEMKTKICLGVKHCYNRLQFKSISPDSGINQSGGDAPVSSSAGGHL